MASGTFKRVDSGIWQKSLAEVFGLGDAEYGYLMVILTKLENMIEQAIGRSERKAISRS